MWTATKVKINEGIRVSNCGVVAFGLYCKKGVPLMLQSIVTHKSDKLLGYGELNLRTAEDRLLEQGITNEVSDCFFALVREYRCIGK